MSRRILITGGGGFVGSHLCQAFAAVGENVTAIDLALDAATRARLAGVRLVEAPLTAAALDKLQTRFDLVIHGAAITTAPGRFGMSEIAQIKANLDLLLDCLDFAFRNGAKHFVFLSSSGVFAPEDADSVLLENSTPSGQSAYAIAKRCGEMIVSSRQDEECAAISVRLGYLYGPGEAARATRTEVSLVHQWLDAAETGREIEVLTPGVRRDWTYAGDLAAALDRVLSSGNKGLVHLGCGVAISDEELASEIARLLPGTRIPRRERAQKGRFKAPMGSTVDLGFPWTSLRDGLRLTHAALVPA